MENDPFILEVPLGHYIFWLDIRDIDQLQRDCRISRQRATELALLGWPWDDMEVIEE